MRLSASAAIAIACFAVSSAAETQPLCPADGDENAVALVSRALERDDVECAIAVLEARHRALSVETERVATIERFSLRDIALRALHDDRLAAESRQALVLAAVTPAGVSNATATDERADAKLLRLATAQFLSEMAYVPWLGVLSRWVQSGLRTYERVNGVAFEAVEPLRELWIAGEGARVLEYMRLIATEPEFEPLRSTSVLAFLQGNRCDDSREPPTPEMVEICRTRLRQTAQIEALGCWTCDPRTKVRLWLEGGIVLHRGGAVVEAAIAVEHAIGIAMTLPPKERSLTLENAATELDQARYSAQRTAELRQDAEVARESQYQPLFPATR